MRMLSTLIVLSFLIITHEFGHAIAMRACGVPVKEVAVGFGPKLAQTELSGGTLLTLRAIPLGGFTEPDQKAIEQAPLGDQLIIDMAGMAVNALTAFLVFLFVATRWRETARLHDIRPPLRWSFMHSFGMWFAFPFILVWGILVKPKRLFGSLVGPIGILTGATPRRKDAKERPQVPAGFGAMMFLGELSVALAGANLLPLAPLDGGMAIAQVLGKIGGPGLEMGYVAVTMSIFAVFIVIIFGADIGRLFGRRREPEE